MDEFNVRYPTHRVCIFIGSEAIDWFLANGFASSREEGVQLGQVITKPVYNIVIQIAQPFQSRQDS